MPATKEVVDMKKKLHNEESYAYDILQKKLIEDPDQVKFTMLDQTYESMGCYGKFRIDLIKSSFRTIIDNVIPPEYKAFFAVLNSMSIDKYVELCSSNDSDEKKQNKRFKASEDSEI
mmetsp:Transcript_28730/g.32845  ORF Transcript_28730/g.32845 Transcript_28730/m.32845 type:complete len:117 (+) Transcript_28730:220-570(+)|eukprot:CAMPEP_0168343584 /NCGR_PEP_ID=MMETSP0213-20121227/16199_1 /TAXON_ID=151035 /ORGANISM="Euplotes harpa, Strain FSP1.4" /LENGTH=116 /DNA_ID=CAMNT_0008350945 /DNA_START=217 /DNA_END=567 /DNA_ORIENTATION=-